MLWTKDYLAESPLLLPGRTSLRGGMHISDLISFKRLTASGSLAIVSIAAFLTRLFPLSMSQYPFNNDSLIECGMASDIVHSGHLTYPSDSPWNGTHSVATPVFNVLIAFFSSSLGINPLQCAQVLTAIVSVLTVGLLFVLGRLVSGSLRGGIVAGFMGVMMGTFVFTTASVWKEALGMAFLALALLSFVLRGQRRYASLTFVVLMLMPLIHHLVTAIALMFCAYMLAWSWYFAVSKGAIRKRHVTDLSMVALPSVWAVGYYSSVSFDRLSAFSSPVNVLLIVGSFALLSVVAIAVLSIKKHSKRTYAPVLGAILVLLIVADYCGFLFPYSPSASSAYILLGLVSAFLFSLSWYGTESVIENRIRYRAIMVGLIASPLTLIGYGLMKGFSLSSHQILYRTFDFLDVFIFLGVGAAMVFLRSRDVRFYSIVGIVMVASLIISFPFSFGSEQLLGVRHDTQAYEVDAIEWLKDHGASLPLVTDVRIGFIAGSVAHLPQYPDLPHYLELNLSLSIDAYYLMEKSWMTRGVNDYPRGEVVVGESNYTLTKAANNVIYVGGPVGDCATILVGSEVGQSLVT